MKTKPNIYINPKAPDYLKDIIQKALPEANEVSAEEMKESNDEIQIAELEAEIEILYDMMASDRPAVLVEAIIAAVEKLAPDQTLSADIETMAESNIAAEIGVEEDELFNARDAALVHIFDGMDAGERQAAIAECDAWDARHVDKRKYIEERLLVMKRKSE